MISIEDLGYIGIMRQRLGLTAGDDSKDSYIVSLSPMERAKLIFGWFLGSENWADEVKHFFESQGIYLTTDANAKDII